jgi:hypothetical protein
MSKRVIKQLSDMAIDEISLVDRGANQHALISFAKRAGGVDELFEKARGMDLKGNSNVKVTEEHHGSDPAGVVDEFVQNDSKGDTGPGGTISGTEKKKGKPVNGKSSPAGSGGGKSGGSSGETNPTDDGDNEEEVESYSKGFLSETDEEIELAKRLGLYLDDEYYSEVEELEKNFGPPQPSPFQQQAGAGGQFGQPPVMQSTGAQPMGMGQPTAPPMAGGMGMGAAPLGGPNPMNPGMASGGPQVPGPTAGQAPPQLGVAQLPPEVTQYIQQLEQQISTLQGSGQEKSSPESSDSSSSGGNSDSSDSSNKPFGKSGDFDMDNSFLEELSKAIRDEDGREQFSKALQTRFEAYETEIAKAQQLASDERDLRLEREFIAKAAEFEVPVAPEELGPVLKRCAESLSEQDFAVIVKCLDAATELSDEIYGEVGKRGLGSNLDIFQAVEAEAEELAKSAGVDGATAVAQVFEANPHAYDQYLANRRQGL